MTSFEPSAKKVLRLLKKGARTPAFFYDRSVVARKYRLLASNLPSGFGILYALKANPNPELVRFIGKLGAGADIASSGELATARRGGIPAAALSFVGPGKTSEELREAIRAGVGVIHAESLEEFVRISRIAGSLRKKARVGVRVNPLREASVPGMKMGGGAKPFGVDEEILPQVFKLLGKLDHLSFRGIHVYTGSQMPGHKSILEGMKEVLKIAEKAQRLHGRPLEIINLGGGFGVPYFEGDKPLDAGEFGRGLKALMRSARTDEIFPRARFFVESGRYLAAESGLYTARILYRKLSRGKIFLVVDGGMNHHLAASGQLGNFFRKNYKMKVLGKGAGLETVTVVGPLCTPLDLLGRDVRLARAEPGDVLGIYNSGAYAYSASPLHFLSHKLPEEYVI
ncbi:MAG TPA: pyridoxal-dependent decarboxylase, exosortase A system-associated [Verrucomicrobiae bacterium]|nr:pyridoxal-dependent decarboxylase, exosortase A system-associated [Verrucomicrobiae bacterium]